MGVNVKLKKQNPSPEEVQNVGSSDTLPDETPVEILLFLLS